MKTKKEIDKINNKYWDICAETRKEWIKFLTEFLQEQDDKTFEFDEEYPIISYDGGNHCEYASNLSNVVMSIYLGKDGELMADTEDSEEYDEDRMSLDDLEQIVGCVMCYID